MTRWIISAIVLALAGCSGSGNDGAPQETLASVTQAASTCKNYDGYTAALAEATVDCLGTVGSFDYGVNSAGVLARRFERCTVDDPGNKTPALLRIDRLLSLQAEQRRKDLPLVLDCIPQAYSRAQELLKKQGISACPTWHKVFAAGVPNKRNSALMARLLPVPVLRDNQRVVFPPKGRRRVGKEYFFYTVNFDANTPEQSCGRAETCAQICANVFEGFYVGRFGKYVVGDPYWWLDPSDYGFGPTDPYYRVDGFYHGMSFAGDDAPGEIYGDYARAAFPDLAAADAANLTEECTRWNGFDHVMGRLVPDTLIKDDPSTWMSRCEFY